MSKNDIDFSVVKRQIRICHINLKRQGGVLWSLKEYISLFHLFYEKYHQRFNKPHPRMNNEQITRILKALPTFTDVLDNENDISLEDYPPLIDSYFEQSFKCDYGRCNYSLLHFTSGKIRGFRYAEVYLDE